jgi:hypothetical protein
VTSTRYRSEPKGGPYWIILFLLKGPPSADRAGGDDHPVAA